MGNTTQAIVAVSVLVAFILLMAWVNLAVGLLIAAVAAVAWIVSALK